MEEDCGQLLNNWTNNDDDDDDNDDKNIITHTVTTFQYTWV